WVLFFCIQISAHLFLDLFNSYGMGLFEPFSHTRISFNTLFVADPFFSIAPAVAFIVLLALKSTSGQRKFWWRFGVGGCLLYLTYCCYNKWNVNKEVESILEKQQVTHQSYFTTPTPLNNWLWYIAVKSDSGFYIGYRSVFDKKKKVDFNFFPSNQYLLRQVSDHEEVQHLLRFSKNFFTLELWGDTLVFNDLRFGQIIGWHDPQERFVFHYYLQHKENANRLVVQRGRFAKWNAETVRSLVKRIAGE
ncbi:MAG TPA: metal-dependent hydrolase, partial [Flavisolibacter sp.]|nr:metal-dependent hydrolase [Flavisolibacter sp.]